MLHYVQSGTGTRKIIFVHGNSQSLKCWEAILQNEKLKAAYSLVAVDLPGHGDSFRSREPEKDYSLKGMSVRLWEFLRAFEKEPYLLVGNSFATNLFGEIAAELVNCKGMMLIGSCVVGKGLTPAEIFQPNPNLAACFIAHPGEEQLRLLMTDAYSSTAPGINALVKNDFNNTDPAFRVQVGQALNMQEYSDEIGKLEQSGIPLSFIFGKEEKIVFTDYPNKTGLRKWRDEIILVEQGGHCLQLDQPEKLVELVFEFAGDCFK